MSADVVTRARRALDLLARGALHEKRPDVRVAVMADLGVLAEAVEELARLSGEPAVRAAAHPTSAHAVTGETEEQPVQPPAAPLGGAPMDEDWVPAGDKRVYDVLATGVKLVPQKWLTW